MTQVTEHLRSLMTEMVWALKIDSSYGAYKTFAGPKPAASVDERRVRTTGFNTSVLFYGVS